MKSDNYYRTLKKGQRGWYFHWGGARIYPLSPRFCFVKDGEDVPQAGAELLVRKLTDPDGNTGFVHRFDLIFWVSLNSGGTKRWTLWGDKRWIGARQDDGSA